MDVDTLNLHEKIISLINGASTFDQFFEFREIINRSLNDEEFHLKYAMIFFRQELEFEQISLCFQINP